MSNDPYYTPQAKELFAAQYEELVPAYEKLCRAIVNVLVVLADRPPVIKLAAEPAYRVKDVSSFMEKLDRKLYGDPMNDIPDFAGVRAVVYRRTDIPVLEGRIAEELALSDSEDKTESLGASLMGYGGTHMVVSLGSKYQGVAYSDINHLRCEVQLRTVLQDAWSNMSHSHFYKTKAAIPQPLSRHFNNLSSLLEVADDNFELIATRIDELMTRARDEAEAMDEGFLNQEVTYATLVAYADKKYSDKVINPHWHEKIVANVQRVEDINAIRDIDECVRRAEKAVDRYCEERPDLFKYSSDYITKSLGFCSTAFRSIHPFGEKTLAAFSEYSHLVME